jgi:glyoxylase-like metal-dependent hydrolase (beta-lactamase superfamily II)
MLLPHAITRLTANNAGPFTNNGTNTYLVGQSTLAVIDPGPRDEAHTQAIIAAAAGRPITHILLTHAHRDHVDGLACLKRLTGAATYGAGREDRERPTVSNRADSPSGSDYADWDFAPDTTMAHGDVIALGDVSLEALHTPGHAPDHLCFALRGTPVLFSGDHVMGWSTSVIAPPEGHMGQYMRSLEALLDRAETHYLPGHGDPLTDGRRTARTYLIHRQMREKAILAAIKDGATTIPAIAAIVYSGIAPPLLNAARLSVQAHVAHLSEKGHLTYSYPLTPDRLLALSS